MPTIVYDDASDPPLAEAPEMRALAGCRIIRGEARRGPAAGRNAIAREIATPYLLSLDDDTYPATSAGLAEIVTMMERCPSRGAVNFRCLRTYDGAQTCAADDPPGRRACLHGGGALLRLSAFRQVGGYREMLGFGCEDTELAWRLIAAGFEVWAEPAFTILHDHVPVARDYAWEEWHYARNTVLMYALNRPWPAGFALGAVKAMRRAMISRRRWSAAAGLAAGILGAVRHFRSGTAIPAEAWSAIRGSR